MIPRLVFTAIILQHLASAETGLAQTAPTPPPNAAPTNSPAPPAPASPSSPGALSVSPRSGHEPTSEQRTLAETLFFAGKGLMEEGEVARACTRFAESYRLDPAAGTLLNLAVCHEKEGKLASAWAEFRQAAGDARRFNRPDREQLAKDEIAKIEPDLPYVTITVPRAVRVPGLSVQMNGVPIEEGAWETELPMDPGTSEITATAPEYKRETLRVTIAKRQHLTLAIAPLELGPPPFMTTKRVIGFTTMGVGAALAGAGAVFGVLALQSKSTSDNINNCRPWYGELRCNQTGSDAMTRAQTEAWIADIGIGVGAVAILTGAGLVLFGGGREWVPAPQGVPPSDHARPQAGWTFQFTGGSRGGEGTFTRAF